MTKSRLLLVNLTLVLLIPGLQIATAQRGALYAPDLTGVFVTPVPGAPFSAMVEHEMMQVLKDGSLFHRQTAAFIARDSEGRIHNEFREVMPSTSTRAPAVLSIHIYDPQTRLNTFLNPFTHIARQRVLPHAPSTEPPTNWGMHQAGMQSGNSNVRVQDLGPSVIEGVDVHGYRRLLTIPDKASGTGKALVVTDEFWYSEELRINLLAKHDDPRTGQSTVTVTQVNVNEPDVSLFAIPPEYKQVDMTPPDQPSFQGPVPMVQ